MPIFLPQGRFVTHSFIFSLVFVSFLIGTIGKLLAAERFDTPWVGGENSQLRLVAAQTEWQGKRQLFAGIEIRLAPKWKTYWRSPGETGIPPYFDWSGSQNLLKAEVLYPVPHRYVDETGLTIGYKSRVILPVQITVKDPSKPVKLNLKANYAICYDICIPVSAKRDLTIDHQRSSPLVPLMDLALSDLPLPTDPDKSLLGVLQVRFDTKSSSQLVFSLKVPEKAKKIDLFVESPDGLYVPAPKPLLDKKEALKGPLYKIDLSGFDDAQKFKGKELICTLKVDERAVVHPCAVE